MTPGEARHRFAAADVARLATVGPDGAPHIVPVTFALDGDRIVTAVDAKPKREGPLRRLTNIATNPRVSVLVDEYDADWSSLWWARADGPASIVESGPALESAVVLLRERYPQYEHVGIGGPVIVIHVDRWTGWRAS